MNGKWSYAEACAALRRTQQVYPREQYVVILKVGAMGNNLGYRVRHVNNTDGHLIVAR